MLNVLLDALIDSAKVLAILIVIYFILSLLESTISSKLTLKSKFSPLIGVALGLLPQCGFSVVATDLYQKRHITVGTLLGIYLATSDEALPIFLANPDKAAMLLPLLGIKFAVGLIVGYSTDLIYSKSNDEISAHKEECEHIEEVHTGCCHHDIEALVNSRKDKIKRYIVHPLLHSLKIFAYILAINIIFGTVIYYVGEEKMVSFLQTNRYIAPLFTVLLGLIPNCASSVVITNLYIVGGIGFGAAVGGLCVNSGLGLMVLFKKRSEFKSNIVILAILIAVSLAVGYVTSLIINFR